jgi:hypothetical protein
MEPKQLYSAPIYRKMAEEKKRKRKRRRRKKKNS